jgi:broad specificity phosphatase PhoE
MKTIIIAIFIFLSGFFPVEYLCAQSEGVTTFILVRHAEKADDGTQNPPLTDQGIQRAENLVFMLDREEIHLIYSTNTLRTMQTVKPLAEKLNLEIAHYNSRALSEFINLLLTDHNGKTIVISGHSNTIPETANLLLGYDYFKENFDESDYENLLIIQHFGETAKMVRLRF